MQKLIKINTDHYVVVDDSEIREKSGDWFYSFETRKIYDTLIHHTAISCKKITHSTQPLECDKMWTPVNGKQWMCNPMLCCGKILNPKTEPLSLQEVKELIGEVDVEKKGENYSTTHEDVSDKLGKYLVNVCFQDGYYTALEDNKEKKYTEEDMKKAFKLGQQSMSNHNIPLSFEYNIKLLQPKTEWEVELVDGKLKLA